MNIDSFPADLAHRIMTDPNSPVTRGMFLNHTGVYIPPEITGAENIIAWMDGQTPHAQSPAAKPDTTGLLLHYEISGREKGIVYYGRNLILQQIYNITPAIMRELVDEALMEGGGFDELVEYIRNRMHEIGEQKLIEREYEPLPVPDTDEDFEITEISPERVVDQEVNIPHGIGLAIEDYVKAAFPAAYAELIKDDERNNDPDGDGEPE